MTVLARAVLPRTIVRWAVTLAIGIGLIIVHGIASLILGAMGVYAQVGKPFTVLAGSPLVNSADADDLVTLPATLAGLLFGGLLIVHGAVETLLEPVRTITPRPPPHRHPNPQRDLQLPSESTGSS